MFSVVSNILKPLQLITKIATHTGFGNLHTSAGAITKSTLLSAQPVSFTSIRTNIRCYFPRPNEVRRIRRHSYAYRMTTPNGRKIIMRKLLKGKHVLSH